MPARYRLRGGQGGAEEVVAWLGLAGGMSGSRLASSEALGRLGLAA